MTAGTLERELSKALGIHRKQSSTVLAAVFGAISDTVAPGEIGEVRGQLPEDMKYLFAQKYLFVQPA